MEKKFKYVENQFLSATRGNYKKAMSLSTWHVAQLEAKSTADATWTPRLTLYQPLHNTLLNEYTTWKAAGGKQEGDTLNVNQLLQDAKPVIREWVRQITGFYKEGSSRYKEMFPNGMSNLNDGSIDSRINAFKTLGEAMGADTNLTTIKTEVQATYANLNTARVQQTQSKGGTTSGSSAVEQASIAAMNMQYRNVGWIMDNFYATRSAICKTVFDLELLRSKNQRKFTGTLEPDETEAVLLHTFVNTDTIKAKNVGLSAYKLFLSDIPNGTPGTGIEIPSNQTIELTISQFNAPDLATYRYITAVNTGTEEIKYTIEI